MMLYYFYLYNHSEDEDDVISFFLRASTHSDLMKMKILCSVMQLSLKSTGCPKKVLFKIC